MEYFGMAGLENTAEKGNKAGEDLSSTPPNLLDLSDIKTGTKLSSSNLLIPGMENGMVMPLNTYLDVVDRCQKEQSYFRTGVAQLTRLGRKMVGAEDASSKFEEARQSGNQGLMIQLFQEDLQQRKFEHKAGNYTAAIAKTALLFTGGKVGWGGLTAVTATDQAKPSDPFQKQAVDAVLGAAKGIATRAVFNKLNETSLNPVTKGWAFGISSRAIDSGLTSDHYLNKEGGLDTESFKAGLMRTAKHVASPEALITDAGTAAVSHLTLMPLNAYLGGAFFKNELASKLTMAGISGLSGGSLQELNRQQDRQRSPIDWVGVAQKGVEKGAIDAISALPGAHLFY